MRLEFVTPTLKEWLADGRKREDLRTLSRWLPPEALQPLDLIEAAAPNITMIYLDGLVVAAAIFDVYKRSVELHGVIRGDLREATVYPAKKIKRVIVDRVIAQIFAAGRDKVVCKVPKGNLGAKGFVLQNGFRKLRYLDKGEEVWVLDREAWHEQEETSAA